MFIHNTKKNLWEKILEHNCGYPAINCESDCGTPLILLNSKLSGKARWAPQTTSIVAEGLGINSDRL